MSDNPMIFNPAGEVLLMNHGEWTGLYNKSGGISIPAPQNVVPPFFTTTTFHTGDVVAIDPGDWVPVFANITPQIGIGTNLGNFSYLDSGTGSPYITGTSGTIPAAWVGSRLSAVVTATTGGGTTTYFLDSGLTIAGATADFPANIPSNKWTAVEIRDAAPEGRRRITLDPSVVVPVGFLVKLYSSTANLGLPNQNAASIAPGESYETNSTIQTGVTAYNSLAWFRTSDGGIQRAHPNNEQVSFVMQGLNIVVPPPVSEDANPDATYNSMASVRTQIQNWINNWNGTIPAGKTANSDRVVGINVNTNGMDLSGLINPQATATTRRIFVRSVGTYSHYSCSVKNAGRIILDNSRGIWVTRVFSYSAGSYTNAQLTCNNSTLCGVTRCMLQSANLGDIANGTAPAYPQGMPYVVYIGDATQFTLAHNLIRYAEQNLTTISNGNGNKIYGNVHDWTTSDTFVHWNDLTNLTLDRNWGCRHFIQKSQAKMPHTDYFQHQGKSTNGLNLYGNCNMSSHFPWWFGTATSPWSTQMFFFRPDAVNLPGWIMPMSGVLCEQNLFFNNNGGWKPSDQVNLTGSTIVRDNTFHSVGDNFNNAGTICNQATVKERNFMCAYTTAGALKGAGGETVVAGTDGLCFITGLLNARNYSATMPYFTYGPPLMTLPNVMKGPTRPGMLKDIHPAVGQRTHWSFAGTKVGATERLREIFDASYRATKGAIVGYPLVPGDVGWPVAKAWNDNYNFDNFVPTAIASWSAYDGNGDIT